MRRLVKVSAYIAVVGLVVTASLSALTSSAFAEKTAKTTSTTKKSDEQKTAKYVGSSEAKKYHRASCEFVKKITKNNRVEFSSPEQAEKAGYTACKVCTPGTPKKNTKAKSGTPSATSEKSAMKSTTTKNSASH